MNPKEEMKEFLVDLNGIIHHGECFYSEEEYEHLMLTLDLFKSSCMNLFNYNMEDK